MRLLKKSSTQRVEKLTIIPTNNEIKNVKVSPNFKIKKPANVKEIAPEIIDGIVK